MTENFSGKSEYEEGVKENYAAILGETYENVLKDVEPDRLHFGPTYHPMPNKNVSLVHQVMIDPLQEQTIEIDQGTLPLKTSLILFAQNEHGSIVGHRLLNLARGDDWLEARGTIATAQRGKGIASTLELATLQLVQTIANNEKKTIYWHVENGSEQRVTTLEKVYTDAESLKEIRNEQLAWKALYNPKGKLGFNPQGTLVIQPNLAGNFVDVESIDSQSLYNWGSTDNRFLPAVITVNKGQRADIQAKKLITYQMDLLPKIQKIITQAKLTP